MNVPRKRELVIEYIQTRRIRKRTPVELLLCKDCGHKADFVSLIEAAKLFELDTEELLKFIELKACHSTVPLTGDVHICLVTFLNAMKSRTNKPRLVEGKTK